MSIALAIISVIVGFFGLMLSSSVTSGPSVVGFGVVLALLARLAQSHDHHRAWLRSQGQTAPVPPVSASAGPA
jgi:hypothetical protein